MITLEQNQDGSTDISNVTKQGDGADQFEVNAANSYATGGLLRQLFHGLGGS